MVYHYLHGNSCKTKKRLSVGRGSGNNSEKVVIKKLLGGDEQKYSMGLKVSIKLSLKLCAWNCLQQCLNIVFRLHSLWQLRNC